MNISGNGGKTLLKSGLKLMIIIALLSPLGLAGASNAEAASQTTLSQYRAWMQDARRIYPYPQSVDKMYRVMMCESTGNAYASQGRGAHVGLFQYAPSTWRGRWNPYRANNIWDARSQIYATARAWSIGMQGQWSCYYFTAGR